MIQLTREFVDRCPVENDFRLRGLEMTRIEVFVDAAFAFAVTLLVISFDAIPIGSAIIGLLSCIAAYAFADRWLPFTLFTYPLLGPWIHFYDVHRARAMKNKINV